MRRLQSIRSTYDADLAKLNASPVGGPASPELIDVLSPYDAWLKRTDGAYRGHAGNLIALWRRAKAGSRPPDDAALTAAAKRCSGDRRGPPHRPPDRPPATTVIAADAAAASAPATACGTIKFTEAFALVRSVPDAECLIVTADGATLRSDGFKELQDSAVAAAKAGPRLPSPFPAGFKVSVDLVTAQTQRRPYVFVWVTDAAGHHVTTLAAYGSDRESYPEMRQWWRLARNDRALQSVTHATQRAGRYP